MARFAVVSALLAAAASWSAASAAQSNDDLSRSNALFEEAKKLQATGHVHEACEKYEASYQLAARGGTLLNLGLCHEEEGKLLVARRELEGALATAKRDGRQDRVPVAQQHLAAVEAKLSWLVLVPPSNVRAEDVELRVDGAPIDRKDWERVPVERGGHVVAAAASGYRTREVRETIGDTPETRTVRIDALEAIAPLHGDTGPARAPEHPAAAPAGEGALRTVALVAGIAGLALSLGTGAWALDRKGVVDDHCNAQKICDAAGASAVSTGRALVLVSTGAFVVGALGFGAWLFLPRAHPGAPAVAGQAMGFSMTGAF